jgi:Tol biopolymer transport system component
MALSPGTRLGPYEIFFALGAGGMGEVYRATDTKLKRQVAIKVLPPAFTTDPDRLARFQREAEVLASINHPNIAAIYGVEDANGATALVLELVEGPTLAERIATGPIPLDEALPIATQIIDALEAAHEKGILHRDLKPANIKIRSDGAVKVLDFGLAKAMEPAATSNASITAAPTVTSPAMMTGVGVILGTAAYMSPEQAKGQPVDARSDIWAFGCVAYEMLTGTRPFAGEDVAETLAAVLRAEPDWTALPANTTVPMRRLLTRCLQKDRRRRLAAIADARLELEDAKSPSVTPRPRSRQVAGIVAGAAIIAAIAAVLYALRGPSDEPRAIDPVQFTVAAPERESFGGPRSGGTGDATQVAMSPDGRHIVFVAGAQGRYHIWLRSIATAAAMPIHGTEGGTFPFWSPDSRFIGFFAGRKLKKVPIAGGPAIVLCDAPAGRGGTWNRDDVILFAPSAGGGLQRVSSAGGVPVGATTLDPSSGETNHRWPRFLPDGRHFFYTATTGTCCPPPKPAVVKLASLEPRDPTVTLMQAESSVFYAFGYLFFARDEALMAQPFDPDTRALRGEAFPVTENISFEGSRYTSASASEGGTLVYGQSASQALQHLTWFDRAGRPLGELGDSAAYEGIALSPSERRVAVAMRSVASNLDLWLFNVASGSRSRLTVNPGVDRSAVWSPDGTRLAFVSEQSGTVTLRQMSIDGAVNDALLESSDILSTTSWSSDGRFIAFTRRGPSGEPDVWALPTFGNRQPFPVAQGEFSETFAVFSPNGRWIAFATTETGQGNVFVQQFPGPGERHQVSTEGGGRPIWRADGKELFYLASNGSLMAVPIDLTNQFESRTQHALFRAGASQFSTGQVYAVTKDGQRFLVNGRPQQSNSTPLTVVVNWKAALRN